MMTTKNHPYYKVANLAQEELEKEILNWSREQLIDWLSWNDPHGVYKDEESLSEFGNIMSIEEGREIMLRQISEGRSI
ncbi:MULTISPECIES: hypothetical protein [Myroides]|uniref:hypothetical protein n=1 Tax=Myroides TaxID=76831 RepID=UPI00257622BA|nr:MULTISPECIES: hypothetical protein [Myroides]MDM1353273.1 hypothetical protein [Myroides marinus]MDM1461191.1 hypothetical protein [Myroides odoratimimus]